MLDNEMGMAIDKVKINSSKLESYINTENKIEIYLESIHDKASDAYKTPNGIILDRNNKDILDAVHTKLLNLKSYNGYIQKYILTYKKTSGRAIDLSNDLRRSLNGKR